MEADIGPVVVATDSPEIAAAVEKAGGRAVMTRADHPSGSDRIFEALGKVDPGGSANDRRQRAGRPADARIQPISRPRSRRWPTRPSISRTLAAEITKAGERNNPNVVKVVGTPVGPTSAARALFHPRHGAGRRGAALSPYRALRLSPRGAGALRRAAAVDAGKARKTGTVARARSRHAYRCRDRRQPCRSASIRRRIWKRARAMLTSRS